MRRVKLLRFLLIFALPLGTAMAAEDGTAASGQSRVPMIQTGSGMLSLIAPSGNSDASVLRRMGRGQRIELSPFADVCFTIRSYKVKPAERLRDNESGTIGYSTCQMGSNYRVRSVEDPRAK